MRRNVKNDRLIQMSKQEELIAKKREELLLKKKTVELGKFVAAAQISNAKKECSEEPKSENLDEKDGNVEDIKPETSLEEKKPESIPIHTLHGIAPVVKNNFCNDGSFLEHFKKILEENKIDLKPKEEDPIMEENIGESEVKNEIEGENEDNNFEVSSDFGGTQTTQPMGVPPPETDKNKSVLLKSSEFNQNQYQQQNNTNNSFQKKYENNNYSSNMENTNLQLKNQNMNPWMQIPQGQTFAINQYQPMQQQNYQLIQPQFPQNPQFYQTPPAVHFQQFAPTQQYTLNQYIPPQLQPQMPPQLRPQIATLIPTSSTNFSPNPFNLNVPPPVPQNTQTFIENRINEVTSQLPIQTPVSIPAQASISVPNQTQIPAVTQSPVPLAVQSPVPSVQTSVPTVILPPAFQQHETNSNSNSNISNNTNNSNTSSPMTFPMGSKDVDMRFDEEAPEDSKDIQQSFSQSGSDSNSSTASSNREQNDNLPKTKEKLIDMVLDKGDEYEEEIRLHSNKKDLHPDLW